MGIGDSIGKAAENAMADLAGTGESAGKQDVPDPTDPNDPVEVHSTLSEGSNAMAAEKEKAPGLKTGAAPGPVSEAPFGGDSDAGESGQQVGTADAEESGGEPGSRAPGSAEEAGTNSVGNPDPGAGTSGLTGGAAAPTGGNSGVPRDIPGSGGLPDSDPDGMRTD